MKRFLPLVTVLLLSLPAAAQPKVYLLPTLHRLHGVNTAYNYDTLRAVITRLQPEVIAVELRPEDIGADTAYLKGNYPYEMWIAPYWAPQSRLQGIDWLGADIEGKPIPAKYWQEGSALKTVERQLAGDAAMTRRRQVCDTAADRRNALLRQASLPQLLNGAYDTLTETFYQCLSDRLQGTVYQYITDFYERRNLELAKRCAAVIMMHPTRSIVILTGADHYYYIKRYLEARGIVPRKVY